MDEVAVRRVLAAAEQLVETCKAALAERLHDPLAVDEVAFLAKLTPRNCDCAWLLAKGYTTDREIATVMGVKASAVNGYVSITLNNAGFSSRAKLALFIARNPKVEAAIAGKSTMSELRRSKL